MLIIHNAKIFSQEMPSATAMVVEHGRILALGSEPDILEGFPLAVKRVNLEGRTLLPGLTDAHVHLGYYAESKSSVDCETASLAECLENVHSAAQKLAPGAWLRGHGWNQNVWKEGFGTAQMLDSVCDEHPVYLTAKSVHAAWVNSRALALAGINAQTLDPPGGKIQRDQSGDPTGILLEGSATSLVESIIPGPTPEEWQARIVDLVPGLWSMGLVGVHDFDSIEVWQALQACRQDGTLHFRVRKNIPFDHLDTFIRAGLRTDFGDDWLHVGSLKLFADGALGPQTAAMFEPYEGASQTGTLLLTEDEIVDIGKRAVSHGIALAIHAIGDRTNHIVLNALEQIRAYEQSHNLPHLRHRIEHVQIVDPMDIPRLAALDIIASVQPVHCPSDMLISDKYLGERSVNAYPFRAIMDTGAKMVFGSDAPVEPINPFQGIHSAVTRRRLDGSPGKKGWHPEQRLSLVEAIDGFSRSAAEIAQRGTRLGSLAPGRKADFLILDEDLSALDPQVLGTIKPAATFVEGKCVFQSRSFSLDL